MTRVRSRVGGVMIAAATLAMSVPVGPANAADVGDPIIEGLAGPLGLAVGSDGTIYVSEAFGGRLTAHKNGKARVLVDVPGQEIAGLDAKGKGTLVYTQTLFDGEAGEEAPPLDAILARVRPNGKAKTIASIQDYEIANNPDESNTYGLLDPSQPCVDGLPPFLPPSNPGIIESHPYAVAIVPGGYAVADAAANAIFKVRKNGRISTVAVLPPIEQVLDQAAVDQALEMFGLDVSACLGETFHGEPVPTDIEVGPDGKWYVSTLPGFPENFGAGAIWRIDPRTGATEMVADGLAGPVDIAVADDGTIWVAELFGFQISKIVGGVVVDSTFAHSPGAIEIAPDGTIYATTGVFTPNGAVVIVTP